MLKHRIITAAILIPIVIAALWFLPENIFNDIIMIVLFALALEWAFLIGETQILALFYAVLIMSIGILFNTMAFNFALVIFSAFFWLLALVALFIYPRGWLRWRLRGIRWLFGAFLLLPWSAGMILLRHYPDGNRLVLFLLVMLWLADSIAYFAGSTYGKHKLAKLISPGKSVEGLVAALFGSIIFAYGTTLTTLFKAWSPKHIILLSFIVVLFSVVGDLTESMIKRQQGVKDSGHILPGHGGLLDRLDSLLAAAPLFALGLTIFH